MDFVFSLGNAVQTGGNNGITYPWDVEIVCNTLDNVVGIVHLDDCPGNYNVVLDNALHKWTRDGAFESTITDPELLAALRIAQAEYTAQVEPEKLTWRFLHLRESGLRYPRFVFTQRLLENL